MCGVYGVASQIETPEDIKIKFSNLGTALGHRGPDGTTENPVVHKKRTLQL